MTNAPQNRPLLAVQGVSKSFPGVQALNQVSLELWPGEVLAVIGENGAGKSTLMNILAGIAQPDRGHVVLEGRPIAIDSVRTAARVGIALIHQELNLADNLSVGANLFLGREPLQWGLIDHRAIRRQSHEVLAQVGLDATPDTLVSALSLGRQQLVEIARALMGRARILIMDEPTSSLSQQETQRLFQVIGQLSAQGVSIIYISHRLSEVRQLADRVVVLRDGCNAGQLPKAQVQHDAMVRLMVGRDVSQFYPHRDHRRGQPRLIAQRLRTAAYPAHEVSFELRAGEIVGLAGLVGAGRSTLLETLFGIRPAIGGEIRLDNSRGLPKDPQQAIASGLGLVPEDRQQQGLILDLAVQPNIGLTGLRRHRRWGVLVNEPAANRDARRMISLLNIRPPHPWQLARFLSGGNQQKVVLAKWLALDPVVLLLDEPTRGIDVGAKQEIYDLMESLAERGVAILFASSDLEEILGMADRVLIMHEGHLSGELARDAASEEAIMQMATGSI